MVAAGTSSHYQRPINTKGLHCMQTKASLSEIQMVAFQLMRSGRFDIGANKAKRLIAELELEFPKESGDKVKRAVGKLCERLRDNRV